MSWPPAGHPLRGPLDLADLYRKFTGWAWYAYAKLPRGELLEGASSLDVLRAQALLPFLQQREGLPREGYRRLDERLTPSLRAQLLATCPSRIERSELVRALLALIDLFDSVSADVLGLGSPAGAPADLGGDENRHPPPRARSLTKGVDQGLGARGQVVGPRTRWTSMAPVASTTDAFNPTPPMSIASVGPGTRVVRSCWPSLLPAHGESRSAVREQVDNQVRLDSSIHGSWWVIRSAAASVLTRPGRAHKP